MRISPKLGLRSHARTFRNNLAQRTDTMYMSCEAFKEYVNSFSVFLSVIGD